MAGLIVRTPLQLCWGATCENAYTDCCVDNEFVQLMMQK